MKKMLMGSTVLGAFMLVGCGGGASTSEDTTTVEKSTGYYVDAKVKGVHYKCGSFDGNTTEEGEFTYEVSKSCTFSLGGIKLRDVNASVLKDHNITILEDDEPVARMLQSLDTDGNTSNGIQLSDALVGILEDNNITEIPEEASDIAELLHELRIRVHDFRGDLVSEDEVREHLNETRQDIRNHGHRTQHGFLDVSDASES
ncbi:MAG: Unknown protein [uncultured Sulfurovum sp.]|uniref:Autotransporter adhesin n=1 Tax=uncultured Sulfurovum sp. TaxID=269237 RepID=A0A6S6U739_9BACT|nr:MAG: Unknown protein [uncultured Sulfurovum sp.]